MRGNDIIQNPGTEISHGLMEKRVDPVFAEIINTQSDIERERMDYLRQPEPNVNPLTLIKSIIALTFLDQHGKSKDIDSLINREAVHGGRLFDQSLPNSSHKRFFYADGSWFLHVGDRKRQETTRFVVHETSAAKITENGRKEDLMSQDEINNLSLATGLYCQEIKQKIYNRSR